MKGEKYMFVVSGPSGTGKDTVVSRLLGDHKDIKKTVSATTRAMREGEIDGVSYHFLTPDQFKQSLDAGGIGEYTCFCDNYYGALRSEVEGHMQGKQPVILVIEVEGAGNIKKLYPGATTIFVLPPNMEELERRLRVRGSEDEATIQKRLRRAETEIARSADYDEHVVNDVVEDCADRIFSIIQNRLAQPE